jgi:N-acetylmuramoyl-L-alanine amidase
MLAFATWGSGCASSSGASQPVAPRDDAGAVRDAATAASDAANPPKDTDGTDASATSTSENLIAKVDTYIKVAGVDSAMLAAEDKCFLAKGTKVSIAQVADAGIHTAGALVSTHSCGPKFIAGSQVFLYTPHFSGWSTVPQQPTLVTIVDNAANYAANCQYRAVNRTRAEIKRIVLHNTESRWVDFKSAWQSCDRIGAAHFVVLRTGIIMRTIAERNVAYHATIANSDSLGVEIESGPGFEGMTAAQEASVIALVKKLQTDFGTAPTGVAKANVTMHRLAAPGSTDCAKFIWPRDNDFNTFRDENF